MEHGQAAVGLGDQRAIDRFGQIAPVERGLQGAVIVARLGREQRALGLRAERGAKRAFESLVARPIAVEDQLAVGPDERGPGQIVALVVEPDLASVAQLHRRPGNVG